MTRYHVNPDTGNPNICRAKVRCDFAVDGQEPPHFNTKEEARAAAEDMLEEKFKQEYLSSTKKQKDADFIPDPPMKKVGDEYADQLAPYASLIEKDSTDRVLVHPQGKIAILDKDGSLKVYKDGKVVPSSLSKNIDKLHNNERVGSWKEALTSGLSSSIDDSNQDNIERQQKLVENGYPLTSHFDPRKTDDIKFIKKSGSVYTRNAILPTSTRVNAHVDLDNEYLTSWGDDTIVEVWQNPSSNKTLAVAGSGRSSYEIGSKGSFEHDQTQAKIGSDAQWELIGAFDNKIGGQAVGEIPNKKIPLYTYK